MRDMEEKGAFKSRPLHSPRYQIISQGGPVPPTPYSHLTRCLKTETLNHRLGGRDKSDPSKQREITNLPSKYLKYTLSERPIHGATRQGRGSTAPPPCAVSKKGEAHSATHFKRSSVLLSSHPDFWKSLKCANPRFLHLRPLQIEKTKALLDCRCLQD